LAEKNFGSQINLKLLLFIVRYVFMKVKIIREVYTDKQRKYMCAMKEPGADRPQGLEQSEAEEMCTGPQKEGQIEEISAAGGGAVVGAAGAFRDDQEDKLVSDGLAPEMTKDLPANLAPVVNPSKAFDVPAEDFASIGKKLTKEEEDLDEMYSTGGLLTYGMGQMQQVDEFGGYKEREKYLQSLSEKPHRKRIKVRFKR
jgi:hypothetical protein